MKRTIWLLLFIACSVAAQAQIIINNTKLAGFRFLSLPRRELPVGAVWNDVTGPNGAGASPQQLITVGSFSNLSSFITDTSKATLELGVLSFLKSGGYFKSLTTQSIELANLSIVGFNDLSLLKNNIGNDVIYEALKVDNIKLIIKKANLVNAKTELSKLFNTVNFTGEYDKGADKEIVVSGLNLFIGYRIIKIQKANQRVDKLEFHFQSRPRLDKVVELTSNVEASTKDFLVALCPCDILHCVQDNDVDRSKDVDPIFERCAYEHGWNFTITLKNQLTESGAPKQYSFVCKTGLLIKNQFFPLYYKPTSDGLETACLNLEQLSFTPSRTMGYSAILSRSKSDAKANITTTIFAFKPHKYTDTEGW
ncbi:hypothetical protein C8P68_106101 [Mucilaginibacter yixingensis]|uniref:Uncharacterized protein n=1 Tax=Mucilaginibacter yixingensis TaxID=1295612 RepID=A0A2T5J742_9SPHI|nr:hypothetical protein [Mucilaginibacter yixingensis]PTQ94891.1 hypothetical protein C8P68_106101 [Mucilaginibacter yixingensis]